MKFKRLLGLLAVSGLLLVGMLSLPGGASAALHIECTAGQPGVWGHQIPNVTANPSAKGVECHVEF
jgi:hypothetical protein